MRDKTVRLPRTPTPEMLNLGAAMLMAERPDIAQPDARRIVDELWSAMFDEHLASSGRRNEYAGLTDTQADHYEIILAFWEAFHRYPSLNEMARQATLGARKPIARQTVSIIRQGLAKKGYVRIDGNGRTTWAKPIQP